jgi:hypothetical protein
MTRPTDPHGVILEGGQAMSARGVDASRTPRRPDELTPDQRSPDMTFAVT